MRRIGLLAVVACLLSTALPGHADGPTTFSNVRYTMTDDVKIAADVYLPPGGVLGGPYPCLVELTPYRKELRAAEGAGFLPARGFVLIEMDARGNGGSQGEYDIVFSTREQLDAAEVIEQSAKTGIPGVGPVCLPKVGMFGGSYSGIIQYLVASLPDGLRPEHLAVIAPQRAYGDLYRDIVYHGGMAIGSFGQIWSAGTQGYYTAPPLDVNTDDGRQAWVDHLTKNSPIMQSYLTSPYIDASYTSNNSKPNWTQKLYEDSSILPRIKNLHVPVLHLAGWFDAFTRGQMLTFQRALAQESDGKGRGPNYLIVGPWNHSNTHFVTPDQGFADDLAAWYHYWLDDPGARPAFMDQPRIRYYMMGTGALLDTTGTWRAANEWPLPGTQYQRFYLHGGATPATGGTLDATAPAATESPSDSYVYNPTAGTAEILSRWDNAASGSIPQPNWDQRTDEPKGLSYTATFDHDVRVAGPISLHLHATTTGLPGIPGVSPGDWPGAAELFPPYHDTDFVVKVSDVAEDGSATLITQGYLRASHRDLDVSGSDFSPAGDPTGDLIRPLHYDDSAHIDPPVPGEDTTYDIEIWPTAKTFAAGHGLRLDIYSADTPGHINLLKPALNTVLHAPGSLSWLELPLIAA